MAEKQFELSVREVVKYQLKDQLSILLLKKSVTDLHSADALSYEHIH